MTTEVGSPPPGTVWSRRGVVRIFAIAIAVVLVLGAARQAFYYSADPAVKDCSPIAGPPSVAPPARPPNPVSDTLPWAQLGGSINDVSCLNPTPVHGIVRVSEADDVRNALAFAARNRIKVSIAGARHSQGGHAFARDAVVLDMKGFNRMSLDETTKVLSVQSGATWHDIQNYLHPRFAVKAMQSTDLFTVGGSISVNAHGMDHQAGSVGGTVRSMRVMLPDGTIHRVSRSEEPELFRLVVGGYGLFGVILDADIEVTENAVYRSERVVIGYEDFLTLFNDRIRRDPSYRLVYGHLSTSPASFLREMLVYTYRQTDGHRVPNAPLGDVSGVRLRRLVFNLSKLGSLPMRLKWWAEKTIEPMLETCPAGHDDGCLVSRNDPMHDSVPYLMNRLSGETDILHEYFIPMDQFTRFIDGLRRISVADRANILNASVRVVHREDNFLSYAPTDMFAIVLYVNQTTDATGTARMATLTRDLIDLTAEVGGRFFLPYQLHYTGEQLRRSYPEIEAFFRAKDAYDPQHVLTNTFYEKYAPMVAGGR